MQLGWGGETEVTDLLMCGSDFSTFPKLWKVQLEGITSTAKGQQIIFPKVCNISERSKYVLCYELRGPEARNTSREMDARLSRFLQGILMVLILYIEKES